MPYVIKKGSLYVAKPGSYNSYTSISEYAQTFDSQEEAEKNACGNESVYFHSGAYERPCPRKQADSQQSE